MKLNLISIAVVAALGASASAQALDFTFDPTGTAGATGDIANVGIIDWAPGSAVAVGGITAINNFLSGSGSTGFTLYYQANLGTLQKADTTGLFLNGAGGDFFTAVIGFGETVTSVGANSSATFALDTSNPVNFFTMYATGAQAANLTGAGFATGTPILQAHLVASPSSNFTVTSTSPVLFDQGGGNGDQWGGQTSVTGSGASDLTFVVDSFNADYFPDLGSLSAVIMTLFNTSQVDPFNQVDPSQCFNTNAGACTGTDINTVGTLGTTNGNPASGGTNFEFQADANQSITVPEPGSVALLGLGLGLMGLRSIRRRAA
jgi:hypothetical protein